MVVVLDVSVDSVMCVVVLVTLLGIVVTTITTTVGVRVHAVLAGSVVVVGSGEDLVRVVKAAKWSAISVVGSIILPATADQTPPSVIAAASLDTFPRPVPTRKWESLRMMVRRVGMSSLAIIAVSLDTFRVSVQRRKATRRSKRATNERVNE